MVSTTTAPASATLDDIAYKNIAGEVLRKSPGVSPKFLESCSAFEESIIGFLNSSIKNVWIYVGGFKFYVRKSTRLVGGRFGSCIDIASIEIPEDSRGLGAFSGLVSFLKKETLSRNLDGVYVECVHEPRLLAWLVFKSFRVDPSDPTSFYWDAKVKMENYHE